MNNLRVFCSSCEDNEAQLYYVKSKNIDMRGPHCIFCLIAIVWEEFLERHTVQLSSFLNIEVERALIYFFLKLDRERIVEAAQIASKRFENRVVYFQDLFKYFCGVCNRAIQSKVGRVTANETTELL